MTCRKFFRKNWSKVTYAQFFAALQETFRGKNEKIFAVLTGKSRTFSKKAPSALQETMVSRIFRIFSPFSYWKIWKNNFHPKIFIKFFEKIFCFHFPFHRFLQCRAARSVTVALPFRYNQPKTEASSCIHDFPANICHRVRHLLKR